MTRHSPVSKWLPKSVTALRAYDATTLRRDLIARGHVFRTDIDTEAILHLYEDKGERIKR